MDMAPATTCLGLARRRARRCAWSIVAILALVGVTQGVFAAPSLAEGIARADQILMLLSAKYEFESQAEYVARLDRLRELLPELETLTATEYTVPIEISVRRYEPDEGYYPVTVHRADLLEPGIEGRIAMPRAVARRAKAALNTAYATLRIGVRSTVEARAEKVVTAVWVVAEDKRWPMVSGDPRFADADLVPPTTVFHVRFDGKSGNDIATSSGTGGWVTGHPAWEDGRRDGALRFDGATRASFPNTDYLRSLTYPLTIGMWIWLEEDTGATGMWDASWTHLAEMWPRHDEYGWVLLIRDRTPEWVTTSARARAFRPLGLRVWHHIALAATEQSVTWYIDGVPSGTTYLPHALRTDHPDIKALDIGDKQRSGTFPFKGKLDDMVVIRGALTQGGVRELMRGVYPTHSAVSEAPMVSPHTASASAADPLPSVAASEPQTARYPTNEAGMQSAIARAEEIFSISRPRDEFENTVEYGSRIAEYNAFIPELRAIASLRFDVPMTVEDVGRYDADAEAFPVTILKEGLLAAAKGTVAIPRSQARSAKSQLRKAWAHVQIRVVPATHEAIPYPEDISVRYQDKMWPVEFQSAWVEGYTIRDLAIGQLNLSPNGNRLAAGLEGGVRVYETLDGAEAANLTIGEHTPDYVWSAGVLEFTPDSAYLIEGMQHEVRVWRVDTAELAQTIALDEVYHGSVHPNGDMVALGSGQRVHIWSRVAGEMINSFRAHTTAVEAVEFIEHGRYLATGGGHGDPYVRVWDTSDWTSHRDLPKRHSANAQDKYGAVMDLTFSSGTRSLHVYAWGTPVASWDTQTWAEVFVSKRMGPALLLPGGQAFLHYDVLDGPPHVRAVDTDTQDEVQSFFPTGMDDFKWPGGHKMWDRSADSSAFAMASGMRSDGFIRVFWRVGADLLPIPVELLETSDTASGAIAAAPQPPTDYSQTAVPAAPVVSVSESTPVEPTETAQEEANAPASGGSIPTHALLVGVDEYDHHANLINPVNDVRAIQAELRDAYRSGTRTLANPTRREFQEALHALADREYGKYDQLLVMFSGHGYFDERIKRGYLAFRDSKPLEEDPYFESYVSHSEVREILERLDCEHVLLVVDSCFAGTLDPLIAMAPGARPVDGGIGLIPAKQYIERKLRFKTRRYITAGGKEYVPDGRPGQHSPFVRQLLAGLRSYGGSDGILTLEELTLYLERVDPHPRTGELYGNEPGSSFVLVANLLDEEEPAPKFASLVVAVNPPDATVNVVGGPPAAESLLKTLRVEPTGTAERRYHLPLGTYRVRVGREGYAPIEREVDLTADGRRVEVRLVHP
jgi:WD40 repeat protein